METKAQVATVTLSYRQTVKSKKLESGRIKVTSNGGFSKHYAYDYSLDTAKNHARAIEQYLNLMEWEGVWAIGATKTGYVAVWVDHSEKVEA